MAEVQVEGHDLILTRWVGVSPDQMWRAWTEPDLLMRWFTPDPVKTIAAEIDPVPGGVFLTAMQLPDGTVMRSEGCILLAEPARRLVFTDALARGFRPKSDGFMTADLSFSPERSGTLYRARVMHKDDEDRRKHEDMGFAAGWGKALDQMVALLLG